MDSRTTRGISSVIVSALSSNAHQWIGDLAASLEMTETEAHVCAQSNGQPQLSENGTFSSLRSLCPEVHDKVFAFLQQKAETGILMKVQAQCRNTIDILSDALERYPYVLNRSYIKCMNTADHPFKTRYPLPLLQRR